MTSRRFRVGLDAVATPFTRLARRTAFLRGEAVAPPLPPGRMIRLGDRGSAFVRDCPGPSGSVPVVLLHGWTLTADVNFFEVFAPLAERHRVIAPDLRMHGRGPRTGPFTVTEATDDIIALLDDLKIDRAIVCGYSMGGGIAAELATRYPDRVAGVVITGAAAHYPGTRRNRLLIGSINTLSLLVACGINPRPAGTLMIPALWGTSLSPARRRWMSKQVNQNSLKDILSVSTFVGSGYQVESTPVGNALPPAEYVLLSYDRLCVPPLQRELAQMLDAHVSPLSAGHGIALTHPEKFATACIEAINRLDDRLKELQPGLPA